MAFYISQGGDLKNMAIIYDLDNEYGGRIIGDGGEDPVAGVYRVTSAATVVPAVTVGRTVRGSQTIAAFRFSGTSVASAAVVGFGGGMISVTSILGIAATGAGLGFDYVLPVEINGILRGIPLTSLASLPGAAAF
jgi:hypothetical protein